MIQNRTAFVFMFPYPNQTDIWHLNFAPLFFLLSEYHVTVYMHIFSEHRAMSYNIVLSKYNGANVM